MGFKVKQLGRTFCAEVTGVALDGDTTEAEIAEFWDLFHEYEVLVLPGQNWDDATQLAFSRKLGPLLQGSFFKNRDLGTRVDTTHLADLSNIDPHDGNGLPAEIHGDGQHGLELGVSLDLKGHRVGNHFAVGFQRL